MSEHKMGPRETALRRYYRGDEEALSRRDVKDELRIARLTDALDEALDAHHKATAGLADDAPTFYAEHEALNKRLRAIVLEAT